MSDNKQFDESWEKKAIKEVLLEHVNERKRTRRWGIFFKIIFLSLFIFLIWQANNVEPIVEKNQNLLSANHIAKIEIKGMIADKSPANADDIIESISNIHKKNNMVTAVVFDINSPGGTPVHARRIYNAIVSFKKENPKIKTYSIIGDIGTSAAYLIASATDEIYADQTSFVGSIGALVNGFGFTKAMENFGIERRLYVAGKYKGMLDPFSEENPEVVELIQNSLDTVHQEFIENVKLGRGDRLKNDPDIFSGRFWTGKEAYEIGLIDGFHDLRTLSKDVIKVDKVVDYTQPENIFDKFIKRLPQKVKSMAIESFYSPY